MKKRHGRGGRRSQQHSSTVPNQAEVLLRLLLFFTTHFFEAPVKLLYEIEIEPLKVCSAFLFPFFSSSFFRSLGQQTKKCNVARPLPRVRPHSEKCRVGQVDLAKRANSEESKSTVQKKEERKRKIENYCTPFPQAIQSLRAPALKQELFKQDNGTHNCLVACRRRFSFS